MKLMTGSYICMQPHKYYLFAATGDGNYAKSARLYLEEMKELDINYSWLYDRFMKGSHCECIRSFYERL